MRVMALDHVNIHTALLAETVRFYVEGLGLTRGRMPAPWTRFWKRRRTERLFSVPPFTTSILTAIGRGNVTQPAAERKVGSPKMAGV